MFRIYHLPIAVVGCLAPCYGQQEVRRIEFPRETFEMSPSQEFQTGVLIRPLPPEGLFSYGVVCTVQGDNGLVGIVTLAPEAGLLYDGALGAGARGIVAEPGKYSVKGSVDVFSPTKTAHFGETLGSMSIAGLPGGVYTLQLASHNTLGPTESVFVDGGCRSLDGFLEFGSATLRVATNASGKITPSGELVRDRQTGLLIQRYEIENTGNVTTTFRIYISNMPTGSTVWNSHGTEGSKAYIDLPRPLGAGEKAVISIEYRSEDRTTIPDPDFELVSTTPVETDPAGVAMELEPRVTLANGNVLLEFNSSTGKNYYLQYSDDMTVWKTALPKVTGTGNRIQWIDNGLPKTDPHPSAARSRFYRILAVQQ